ncbi:MAG: PQQ-binding-like beta-propeller repeat protein [Candidatus Latescibacteria bacterium]|nr:PQQ-binding-like beta-propeller repeat protein [Candidatus Latescibacterota bacterium]
MIASVSRCRFVARTAKTVLRGFVPLALLYVARFLLPTPAEGVSAPTVRWQTQVEERVSTAPVRDGERLYLGDRDGRVYALEATTGTQVWWTRVGEPGTQIGQLAWGGDYLYAQAGDQVTALRPADGTLLWSRPFGVPRHGPATPPFRALRDGLLVSDTLGTRLLALDGAPRWERPELVSAMALEGDTLYLNDGKHVAAVSMERGATLWTAPLDGRLGRTVRVHGDRVFATATSVDAVIALDRRDGSTLWQQEVEAWDFLDVFDVADDRVYIVENRNSSSNSSDIGRLVILSAATGQVLVRDREGANIDPSSFALGGTVFLGRARGLWSLGGEVSAVEADGTPRWSLRLPRAAQVRVALGDLASGDSVLFAGDGSGGVYGTGTSYLRALALADGEETWRLSLAGDDVYPPLVEGGTVYAVTDAGHVYAACGRCPVALDSVALSAPGLVHGTDEIYHLQMEAGGRLVLQVQSPESAPLPGDVALDASALRGWFPSPKATGQLRYLAPASAPNDTLQVRVQQTRTGFEQEITVAVELSPVRDERLRWRASTQGQVTSVWCDTTGLYIADREVTDEAGNPGSSGLYAFDPATGTPRWRLRLPEGVVRAQPHNGVIYASLFASKAPGLWAVRAADGQLLWRAEVGRNPSTPVVGDGLVFVSGGDTIAAFDAATETRRWALDADVEIGLLPRRLRLEEGRLFADWSGEPLLVLDSEDGRVLWGVPGETGMRDGGPVVDGGRVYTMDDDGQRVSARAVATGEILWTSAAVVDPNYLFSVGDTLYHGGPGELVALQAATGTVLWHVTNALIDYMSPVAHGDLLFTTSPADFPAALSRADGQAVWEHPAEPGFSYFYPDRATLYVLVYPGRSEPRQLRGFDTLTGTELWRYEDVAGRALGWSYALDPSGRRMYFGAEVGYLAALDTDPEPMTAVLEEGASDAQPSQTSLGQNFPNPFNAGTVIQFSWPTASPVELVVFNLAGQKVAMLTEGLRPAGQYRLEWDGRDDGGRELASGVYLYRLQAGDRVETRKLLLLR